MLVYPHRITPFEETNCDICKKNLSKNLLLIDSVPFKGLQYCDNISCKVAGKTWLKSCTVDQDILEQKYGSTISIKRSNGDRETGWKISSPAFQEESGGKYWIKITKYTKSKFITLDLLFSWNPTFDRDIYPSSPEISHESTSSRKSFSDISLGSKQENNEDSD